ncbi:hypothetical protein LPJ66_004945 [Kickxella alabastrina]|uniref:Uncharacterized protein n=1 Tax=Kickxella alabastrina TaxID=61397 RepID=A0ACC1IGK5_9FUNG|nr:hypothetical protein LPJ66_004945 [Kickxella alabastrina]
MTPAVSRAMLLRGRAHSKIPAAITFQTKQISTSSTNKFSDIPGASEVSRKGSYSPFLRRLACWIVGIGAFASVGYIFGGNEIEAFDNQEPPQELRLLEGQTYKGYPIIDTPNTEGKRRERLIVLGSGWGAVSILKTLRPDTYDVTVVSPDNYFIFTPLLPSVTVGTVEFRSVLEAIRRIIKRIQGSYIQAAAVDIDFEKKYVLVERAGEACAWLPYDRLVVGVGAQSSSYGVKGLEFCHRLKTINDARGMRQHIMGNFEKAVLPTTPVEEKQRLLTFVICGGGPTGCEFAAELHDFLSEDLKHYFPRSIQEMVRVIIVQSQDHILNMMDSVISEFAENEFSRHNITVLTNSRVKHVTENSLVYTTKRADGTLEDHEIMQGFVLWSTGNGLTPFTQLLCDRLPQWQNNKHAITVDDHLRVKGVADGSAYALGDCATVEFPHLLSHINELFNSAHHSSRTEITRKEFRTFIKDAAVKFPSATGHLQSLDRNFELFDTDGNGSISLSEFKGMLEFVDSKLTALPALAQVASQEGVYLAHALDMLAYRYRRGELPIVSITSVPTPEERSAAEYAVVPPFLYHHRGTLAYLGRAAAADFGEGRAYRSSNLVAKYLWRSVYWSQQVSLRTRILLMMDWFKELVFGRDLSKF